MAEHQGPDGLDPAHSAAVDDAALALLATWDAAREQATHRLSAPQLGALLAVENDEGINLRGLAGRLDMILSSASRLCDRLVAAGLVTRRPGSVDRREVELRVSPEGQRLVEQLRDTRVAELASVLAAMPPEGRRALLVGLREFQRAAERLDGADGSGAAERRPADGSVAGPEVA